MKILSLLMALLSFNSAFGVTQEYSCENGLKKADVTVVMDQFPNFKLTAAFATTTFSGEGKLAQGFDLGSGEGEDLFLAVSGDDTVKLTVVSDRQGELRIDLSVYVLAAYPNIVAMSCKRR